MCSHTQNVQQNYLCSNATNHGSMMQLLLNLHVSSCWGVNFSYKSFDIFVFLSESHNSYRKTFHHKHHSLFSGSRVLMLKSHIWTITYLQIDQTNEHMIAKAAPAEERLRCSQILVIFPLLKLYDCRRIEMTSLSLHFWNNWNLVIESLLSHLPLVSHSLLLHTLNNTASICLMNHITLLVCCF